jgi:hypothetical protein
MPPCLCPVRVCDGLSRKIDDVHFDLARAKYGIWEIKTKQLKEYDICGMPTFSDDLVLISEMLKTNTSLQTLRFETEECCDIGGAFKDLGEALRVNTTLTELDIYHHPEAPAQHQVLADSIAVNKGLKLLKIDDISDEGHEAMLRVMPLNGDDCRGVYRRDIQPAQSGAAKAAASPSRPNKRSTEEAGGGARKRQWAALGQETPWARNECRRAMAMVARQCRAALGMESGA